MSHRRQEEREQVVGVGIELRAGNREQFGEGVGDGGRRVQRRVGAEQREERVVDLLAVGAREARRVVLDGGEEGGRLLRCVRCVRCGKMW